MAFSNHNIDETVLVVNRIELRVECMLVPWSHSIMS